MRWIRVLLPLLLVGALGWFGWSILGSSNQGSSTDTTPEVEAPEEEPSTPPVEVTGPVGATPSRTRAPEIATQAPPDVVAADEEEPESYREALCGVTGRLVEEDGTPVVGMPLELLELHPPEWMAIPSPLDQGKGVGAMPPLTVSRATSGEDGRFRLGRARHYGVHGLGTDLGGDRAAFRVLDVPLMPGADVDVGDVVLDRFVTFTGRVVTPEGEPLAGARVRATVLPAMVLLPGVADVRSDSALFIQELNLVLEAPESAKSLIDRLPIPTTHSDAEGRFELAGVPEGMVTLVADKPGFLAYSRTRPSGRGTSDVGDVALQAGATVEGVVVTADGKPVPRAEILVATMLPEVGIAQRARPTDANGAFHLSGLPPSLPIHVGVRTTPEQPWQDLGPFDAGRRLKVVLEGRASMTLVLQTKDGTPVRDADLYLMALPDGFVPPIGLLAPVRRIPQMPDDNGRVVLEPLPTGHYRVQGSSPTHGLALGDFQVSVETPETLLVFEPGITIPIQTVDAETGESLAWCQVRLLKGDIWEGPPLGAVRTDLEGRGELGPVPLTAPALQSDGLDLSITADHPGYARIHLDLSDWYRNPDLQDGALVLPMSHGGSLQASVHVSGHILPFGHFFILESRSDPVDEDEVRFAATDVAGICHITNLAPGTYRYDLFERFLFQDMHRFIPKVIMDEPDEVTRGEFTITAGETTELVLDVSETALSRPAAIHGRIDGEGSYGRLFEVRLNSSEPQVHEVPGGSTFHLTNLEPGYHYVQVSEIVGENRQQVLFRSFNLAPGQEEQWNVKIQSFEVRVHVVDARTDLSLPGARLNAYNSEGGSSSSTGPTDQDGMVDITLHAEGEHTLRVEHEKYGMTEVTITPPVHRVVEVRMDPGVPCAGVVEYTPAEGQTGDQWYLIVSTDGRNWVQQSMVDPKDPRFEMNGLTAGNYQAMLFNVGSGANPMTSFTLADGGDRNLVLRFE